MPSDSALRRIIALSFSFTSPSASAMLIKFSISGCNIFLFISYVNLLIFNIDVISNQNYNCIFQLESYKPNKNAAILIFLFFIIVAKLLIKNTYINIIKYNVKTPLKKMNLLKWSADCKKKGI